MLGALGLAVTVLLAACGSGGQSAGKHSKAANATGPTKITIATVAPAALLQMPAYAKAQGIFAKYGLEVTVKKLTSSTIYPAFSSGNVQFAAMPAPQPEEGQLRGVPLKWIASWSNIPPFDIVAAPGIRNVADLKGKKIAYTARGSTTELFPKLVLDKFGVPESSVKFVPLGSVSTNLSSFASGAIDAFATAPPVVQAALEKRKGASVIYKMGDLLQWPSGGLAAYMPYVKSHSDVAQKVVKALQEATKSWLDNPEAAQKVIAKQTKVSAKLAAEAYKALSSTIKQAESKSLAPQLDAEKPVISAMKSVWDVKGAAKAKPSDFVDMTYVGKSTK